MDEIFGVPIQAFMGQLMLGLVNGSFYALLSLGLAVIFGMLNIVNFAHGALYMVGAFFSWMLLNYHGVNYWSSLVIVPIAVGLIGVVIEKFLLQWLQGLDHLYGLLLTFGLALIIQGVFRNEFGSSGLPYQIPPELAGGVNLGFMFLPKYRAVDYQVLLAPRGTPRAIVDDLYTRSNAVLSNEDMRRQFAERGSLAAPMRPDELLNFMQEDLAAIGATCKAANITAE